MPKHTTNGEASLSRRELEIMGRVRSESRFLGRSGGRFIPLVGFFGRSCICICFMGSARNFKDGFVCGQGAGRDFLAGRKGPFVVGYYFTVISGVLLSVRRPRCISELISRHFVSSRRVRGVRRVGRSSGPIVVGCCLGEWVRLIKLCSWVGGGKGLWFVVGLVCNYVSSDVFSSGSTVIVQMYAPNGQASLIVRFPLRE